MDARLSNGNGRKARPAAWATLAVVVVLSVLPAAAGAAERVALVIGNSDYEHVPDLHNPPKDAADVGAALTRLGFAVTSLDDASREDLFQRLEEFQEAASKSKIAVVFYAGHGIEVDKHNYLVPVEAKLETDRVVRFQTIPLDLVMTTVEGASTLGMVILDACRDNPFLATMKSTGLTRSVNRGLARAEPTGKSMLVAYSAREGTTALDGEPGGNSPYTEALLKYLEQPGLHVGDLFIEVRKEVLAKTGSQTPVEYGALVEKVFLAPEAAPSPPPPPPKDTGTATAGGTSPPSGDAARAYEATERAGTVAAYRAFIKRFPYSFEAKLAQVQIDKLEGAKEPLVVAGGNTVDEGAPATPTPEAVEKRLGLTREERRLVQVGLAAAGYDPGPADGWIGRGTREALRRWQGARGEPVTGYLDADGAKALLAMGEQEAARRASVREPGTKFRDCPGCPELVVVPSGSYRMGSPESESGRGGDEGPVRLVTIGYRLAVGVKEVTRGEFARFVSETRRAMGDSCWTYEGGEWEERSVRNWKSPGYGQTDEHPVVCVNWDDAKAYVDWLSGKTGKEYRLLSEAEWEYVARAGTGTARYWGESESGQCRYANGADASTDIDSRIGCNDRYPRTAPVGTYEANGFGLHDVLGNVWEWTEDCYNESYAGAPWDGSTWESGNCDLRVVRGGTWSQDPSILRSADRYGVGTGRDYDLGFRIARTLTP